MNAGKKGLPIWAWLLILLPVVTFVVGIAAALAIFGVRKYIVNAKEAEASTALTVWGDGIVRCAERDGRLPSSATAVPTSLDAVKGHKYQSAASEWSQDAHTCASFSRSDPQYFQYSWTLRGADAGVLMGVADLDGDGAADSRVEVSVSCAGSKCTRGSPVVSGRSDRAAAKGLPRPAAFWSMLAVLIVSLAGLGAASVWVLVLAFQTSVSWGLIALLVPFGRLAFTVTHWSQAKRAFFLFSGSLALMVASAVVVGVSGQSEAQATAVASSAAGAEPAGVVALPPLPPSVAVPDFDGSAVDVSSVMGRARKLAEQWEADATLLGLEATVQNGKIQPQLGGTATVTFGPSRFASSATRTGRFVVTYDRAGIHGAPQPGKPSAVLPEPMCAPETALARATELGSAPLLLRYGLDAADRPSWLVSVSSDAAQLRVFEPQACAPRGSVVVRPRF